MVAQKGVIKGGMKKNSKFSIKMTATDEENYKFTFAIV